VPKTTKGREISKILITGGTGTLGTAIIDVLLHSQSKSTLELDEIVILSRNETEQYKLKVKYGSAITLIIGDVRDYEVTHRAMDGVDFVIHAAAIKHIDIAEKNPFEAIKTNIQGTQNVLRAAVSQRVDKLINISTDKTCNPNSTYGATKLIGERLTSAIALESGLNFSTCRFGNILGSNGSVFHLWKSLARSNKPIPITSLEMTRFFISIENSARFVFDCLRKLAIGSIYVPLLNSFSMREIATYLAPQSKLELIGLRPGEKVHEDLLNPSEYEYAKLVGDVIEISSSRLEFERDVSFKEEIELLAKALPEKWLSSEKFTSLEFGQERFFNTYTMNTPEMRKFLDEI